jgi:hypothetical protein
MISRIVFACAIGAAVMPCAAAFAQVSLPGMDNTLSLVISPSYPEPNQVVTVTAQDPYVDLSSSNLTWYVGGKKAATSTGALSIPVTLGAAGTETDVAVTADTDSGQLSAQAAIIPTVIDLLWESDSYTPPFYRGRALPSVGTSIRIQAVPHFFKQGGATVSPQTLTYLWKLNGVTLGSSSGLGKSAAVIPIAPFSLTQTIEVYVTSSDGLYAGRAAVTIPTVQPLLTLYEDHPLFGLLFGNAVPSQTTMTESEVAFAVVPYFASIASVNDPKLTYNWQVNDRTVPADPKQPSEITISAKTASAASLLLGLNNPSSLFLDLTGAWNILFGSAAQTTNPFTNPTPTP